MDPTLITYRNKISYIVILFIYKNNIMSIQVNPIDKK